MNGGAPRVLVTGGAGFIGSHLVDAWVRRGASVTVVDDLSSGSLVNLRASLDAIRVLRRALGEALDAGALDLADVDLVYHLAGSSYVPWSVTNPTADFQKNTQTTLRLLEALRASRRRPRLIFASSAAVYGSPARLPIDEHHPLDPVSPYGVSKLAAERYISVYARLFDVPAVSLRLFSLYGPRLRKQVIYDLLECLERDSSQLSVWGDGTQQRDFLFVDDLVDALLLAARLGAGKGEVFNVASGTSVTIRDLVALLCRTTGACPEVAFRGDIRPGDVQRWAADISAFAEAGFTPKVALEAGLQSTFAWFRTRRG